MSVRFNHTIVHGGDKKLLDFEDGRNPELQRASSYRISRRMPKTIARKSDWLIREIANSDRNALVKYANNPNVANNLRDVFPSPYTEADADAWLDVVAKGDGKSRYAIANGAELIGGIGVEPQTDVHRRSAEIGFWLGEPHWGRGIATWAVEAMTRWAFSKLDLARIYATVFESNRASARVLEKAGYELEGTLRKSVYKGGVLMDSFLYAILRESR